MQEQELSSNKNSSRPDDWIGIEADYRSKGGSLPDHLHRVSRRDLATHALMLGKTGSGKTTCLTHLVAGLIQRKESYVLVDARGDQVNDHLSLLAGRIDPELVKVIDLRDSTPHTGFDPLGGSGLPHKRALNVLSTIRAGSEGWGVQLDETLRNFLTALAESSEPLTQLESALYDPVYREWMMNHTRTESVRSFLARYHSMREDRQASLAMPVMNKVSALFATRKLKEILSDRNPVDLAGHLNTPGSVLLVSLAIDETADVGRAFGSMILGCLTQAMFSRVGIDEKQRNPVLLVLDEFSNFADSDIDCIIAEGRRFGFSLLLAHQTLAQVGANLRSLILGNVGMKFVFRLGRDDAQTMSGDLTGNKSLIDFTKLHVGTCVIAKGNSPLVGIEVNSPLGNGGMLDEDAKVFLHEVHRAHPNWQYESPVSEGIKPDRPEPKARQPRRSGKRQPGFSLEDWL